MKSNKCPKCGLVSFASALACKRCNTTLGENNSPAQDRSFSAGAHGGVNNSSTSFGGVAPSGDLYYKPSGDVTMAGMFGGLAGGLVAGAVLAFAYTYIIYYVPFIYLNFLCTIGFAAALGFTVGFIMRWGKVRNPAYGACFSFLVGAAALYISWAVWLAVLLTTDEEPLSALMIVQHPLLMWETIVRVNEVGAWKMYGSTVSGFALWAVWLIEALVILIGVPAMTWGALVADPFCESCQTWCALEKGLLMIGEAESGELKRRVEAKDFDHFKHVGGKREDALNWHRVDLHQCPHCGKTNALSMYIEKLSTDSKGNTKVESSQIVGLLLLSAGDAQNLRRVSQEVTAAAGAQAQEAA